MVIDEIILGKMLHHVISLKGVTIWSGDQMLYHVIALNVETIWSGHQMLYHVIALKGLGRQSD